MRFSRYDDWWCDPHFLPISAYFCMSISYICMIMRSNQCWQNAKYIGGSCRAIEGKTHIVHYIKYSSFYKITLALALPKDHNPVNTTFFDKKDKNTKKTKKTQKDKKVISGDLVLMKYVKDPTIRHQIKLIFPSYFNLYSIKCSSFLSSCLEEKPFHSAGIGLPQFWQRHRGDPIPAQELD